MKVSGKHGSALRMHIEGLRPSRSSIRATQFEPPSFKFSI